MLTTYTRTAPIIAAVDHDARPVDQYDLANWQWYVGAGRWRQAGYAMVNGEVLPWYVTCTPRPEPAPPVPPEHLTIDGACRLLAVEIHHPRRSKRNWA